MKRFLQSLIPVVAVALFACSFWYGTTLNHHDTQMQQAVPCYAILYPYEGYIGVYPSSDDYQKGNQPKQIIKTPISSLPLSDQNALKEGIILKDKQSLRQLTEDFEIRLFKFFG